MRSSKKMPGLVLCGLPLMLVGACSDSGAGGATAKGAPREACIDKVVTRQKPVKDEDRVQKSVQDNATEQTTERVCETVYD